MATKEHKSVGKNLARRVDFRAMHSVFSKKAVQMLVTVSMSLWMAGGCLFGCSTTANGAQQEQTGVAAPSCHAKHFKHAQQPSGVPSFAPAPRQTMKDCPLVVNGTAATSKNSGHVPDPGRGPVSALPLIEKTIVQSNSSLVVEYLPNRGPTHLRCCVFLI